MTDLCAATHTKPGSTNVHRCYEPDDQRVWGSLGRSDDATKCWKCCQLTWRSPWRRPGAMVVMGVATARFRPCCTSRSGTPDPLPGMHRAKRGPSMIVCGDIGEGQREWEFEPLEVPTPVEVPETVPAEPEPVPA